MYGGLGKAFIWSDILGFQTVPTTKSEKEGNHILTYHPNSTDISRFYISNLTYLWKNNGKLLPNEKELQKEPSSLIFSIIQSLSHT